MPLKLNKYFCKGCEIVIGPTTELIRKCGDCGSGLLDKKEIALEDYMRFIELELESANHHSYIELPEKLYNKLLPYFYDNEKEKLARIIAEEFYANI
jgi:hypothetical protein